MPCHHPHLHAKSSEGGGRNLIVRKGESSRASRRGIIQALASLDAEWRKAYHARGRSRSLSITNTAYFPIIKRKMYLMERKQHVDMVARSTSMRQDVLDPQRLLPIADIVASRAMPKRRKVYASLRYRIYISSRGPYRLLDDNAAMLHYP